MNIVRPTKPDAKKKKSVSFSLTLESLVILDNLARVAKSNRSKVIDLMLRSKGMNELGLSALEEHAASVQRWTPRNRPDDPGACNPHIQGGRCTHSRCVQLYRKWGI